MSESEKKLFITTSDLIKRINASLDQEDTSKEESSSVMTTTTTAATTTQSAELKPKFELQKRLPDGSTLKADEQDMEVADLQSKIKQCADLVSALSPSEKFDWANEQRQHGNDAYSAGNFKAAIDIYLTCLVAIDPTSSTTSATTSEDNAHDTTTKPAPDPASITKEDETLAHDQHWTKKSQLDIQLPVLLNLSACTLQLKMFKKTKTFCDIALELECAQTNAKVYFRRGKALMNMGEYKSSRRDLERALELLLLLDNDDDNDDDDTRNAKEKESVAKELKKLEKMMESAEINRKRQKVAMRKMLGGKRAGAHSNTSPTITIIPEDEVVVHEHERYNDGGTRTSTCTIEELSDDQSLSSGPDSTDRLYSNHNQKRAYSTLRATKRRPVQVDRLEQSYFQWYLEMMERSLRKVLFWLGDAEAMTKDFSKEE